MRARQRAALSVRLKINAVLVEDDHGRPIGDERDLGVYGLLGNTRSRLRTQFHFVLPRRLGKQATTVARDRQHELGARWYCPAYASALDAYVPQISMTDADLSCCATGEQRLPRAAMSLGVRQSTKCACALWPSPSGA